MFPFSILWGASRYHIRSAQYSHCGILAEIEVAKHSAETFDSWIPKQGSSHKRMSKRHITDSTNIQYIWLGFSLFPATCITLSPIYRQRLSDCLVYCFLIPSQSKTHDYRKKDAWMEFLFVRNWICFKGKEKKAVWPWKYYAVVVATHQKTMLAIGPGCSPISRIVSVCVEGIRKTTEEVDSIQLNQGTPPGPHLISLLTVTFHIQPKSTKFQIRSVVFTPGTPKITD